MGSPGNDPYADLLARFQARRDDYLARLISDEETFASDPAKYGTAKRRGYLKGTVPPERPTCSLSDQDAASVAASADLIVWTDTPCLRAGIPEPWDNEDLQAVIARLTLITEKDAFEKSIVIPEEPAGESATSIGFRPLLRLLRQLTLCGRGDVRNRIRTLLANARDGAALAPDFNPIGPFDSSIIEAVVESLDLQPEPDPTDTAKRDDLAYALTALRIEGEGAAIDLTRAQQLVKSIYALLPSAVAIKLLQAAIDKGRPGNYVVQPSLGWESPPDTGGRESPGTFGARESPGNFGARELPGSFGAREDPHSTFEDPNPKPPPPRGGDVLLGPVWSALQTLAWFGKVGSDTSYTVRSALLALAVWVRTAQWKDGPPDDKGRPLLRELFEDHVWIPPHTERAGYTDFAWPPYTRVGIYWWRTVISPQCIGQCFALNETADFHSTDLIRFLHLFPAPDDRVPDYVYTAVTLALLWFKYWWDEPAASGAEMTMWSENHQILFAQSQLLAGCLFRDTAFARSQNTGSGADRTGQDHINEGSVRVERWLDLRLKLGFSEWNAPGYYNEDFPPLYNLADFVDPDDPNIKSDDERASMSRIKVKAAMVLDLMIFDCARFTCRGSFGATAGRAYWEHKCYGWEQSIGESIEILFGTRGDFVGNEPAALALATSTYVVPEALLAIGLDRAVLDQTQPFTDRTRVSADFSNCGDFGIGFDTEQDAVFWWGLEAYYTDKTLELTKRVVAAHDNLRLCGPFDPLYAIVNLGWLKEALVNLISISIDVLQVRAGVALVAALPFPLDLVALGIEGKSIVDGVVDFFKDVWDYVKNITKSGPLKGAAEGAAGGAVVAGVPGAIVGGVAGFFGGLFGDDESDSSPTIPDTELQKLLESLLIQINQGTVLSTANIVAYNNGDSMLSSVQNHLPGLTAFQKQPWMANLGLDACVWTTARFMAPDLGSYASAWGRFFSDLGLLRLHEAAGDLLATPALQLVGKGSDLFGHDGPNYWTGSLALPMIVQHENAAIIAYDIPALQRSISGFSTHAWFPKQMFDETRQQDSNGGTWFFGRKDHLQNGVKVGSGYVALFSALPAYWTNESGNAWNDKEIKTELPGVNILSGSNVWISVVSSEHQYSDADDGKQFDTFCQEIQDAPLHVSGIGAPGDLECTFDVPRAVAPAGKSPTLTLSYGSKTGSFAGEDLQLDNFPRFENRYTTQMVATSPSGSGLRPQVEGFTTVKAVGFGSTGYRISHPPTGLTLDHDTSQPSRRFNSQKEQAAQAAVSSRRLEEGLTAVRRIRSKSVRPRPIPHVRLDRSAIRRRTP